MEKNWKESETLLSDEDKKCTNSNSINISRLLRLFVTIIIPVVFIGYMLLTSSFIDKPTHWLIIQDIKNNKSCIVEWHNSKCSTNGGEISFIYANKSYSVTGYKIKLIYRYPPKIEGEGDYE